MLLLKIIFFPIYIPFAIIINILKLFGMIGFAEDIWKWGD
jgi:hypothetical protein